MVEKLRSISKRIHWSLLLKACIFAAAWLWLPFWLFFLIALYLYFVPIFETTRLAAPLFVLLLLCLIQTPSLLFALVFGVVFFGLLLIKGLLLIDRRSAYEMLVLVLVFLFVRDFYARLTFGVAASSLIYAFLTALVLTLLLASYIRNFRESVKEGGSTERVALWILFILFWQLLIVGLFLPIDMIYQTAVVFLAGVALVEFVPSYLFHDLTRERVLATSMTIFALLVIVIGLARWTL